MSLELAADKQLQYTEAETLGDMLRLRAEGPQGEDIRFLYVGEDDFIHSSSSGVEISNIRNPYWSEHLVAARRIVR